MSEYDPAVEWAAALDEKDDEIERLKDLQRLSDDTIRLLNIENAQLRAERLHWEQQNALLEDEFERLRAERAGDQQRLFHYEAEIERLRTNLNAVEAIGTVRDRARAAIANRDLPTTEDVRGILKAEGE